MRVLFGGRTSSSDNSSKEASVKSENAFHFVVEHFDPATQLQVWRTYFLESNTRTNWDVRMIEEEAQGSFLTTKKYAINRTENPDFERRDALVSNYIALVQGVLDGIATVSRDYRNLTKDFLLNHIVNKINTTLNGAVSKDQLDVYL